MGLWDAVSNTIDSAKQALNNLISPVISQAPQTAQNATSKVGRIVQNNTVPVLDSASDLFAQFASLPNIPVPSVTVSKAPSSPASAAPPGGQPPAGGAQGPTPQGGGGGAPPEPQGGFKGAPITSAGQVIGSFLGLTPPSEPQKSGEPVADAILKAVGSITGSPSVEAEPYLTALRRDTFAKNPTALPSASDLVLFELREVFRPEFREQQLQPPPSPDFLAYMSEAGYSEYFASSYWAAHWQLPSTQQAYDMLHRLRPGRVPDSLSFQYQDMVKLLRRNDILPAFIDQLAAISYDPYTRVDVRRMYHSGVLSEDEVFNAYLDLGYDEQHAGNLTAWTKKDADPDQRALDRSDVLAAYAEDLITIEDARVRLGELNLRSDGIDFILQIAARKKQREYNKKHAPLAALSRTDVLGLYQSNAITYAEALTWFQNEEYDARSIELLLQKPTSAGTAPPKAVKAAAEKKLTLSQILSQYKQGIITTNGALEALMGLHYSQKSAQGIIDVERSKDPFRYLVFDFKAGAVTEQAFRNELIKANYSIQEQDTLIQQIKPSNSII